MNFPTEAKVKAATAAGTVTTAVVTLIMYGLDQIKVIHSMDDFAKGAILVIVTAGITGGATFVAGWYAKHTPRPEAQVSGLPSSEGGVTDGPAHRSTSAGSSDLLRPRGTEGRK